VHLTQLAAVVGPVLAALGALSGLLWKKYRGSAGKELQPFRSYVAGSIRLAVTRRVRPRLAARIAVRTYADVTLKNFTRHMPIPSRGRSTLDIERAYIRLSLSATLDRRVDDEVLLTAKGGVLVFGEPGSGKSSLTRKLHREALKQAYLRPMRSRLPLHLELGKLRWDDLPSDRHDQIFWFLAILKERIARVKRVNQPGFVFDAFGKGPGFFITLDGLDEVPSDKVAVVQRALVATIETLTLESPETAVIVTARSQMRAVLARAFVERFGEVLTVTPFTPADVFAFLRRWEFPPKRRLAEVHRIFDHLRNNATLSEMCTNPLVLAMYVAEDELHTEAAGSAVRLADTRAKFYDQVVGEFLFFRRQEQHSPTSSGMRLLVTRQELLGQIALDHLMYSDDPANVVSLARATRIAQRHWELDHPGQAAARLEQLAVDSGLVTVQVGGESLQFIHLSIAEYLAGKELAEGSERGLNSVLEWIAFDDSDARRLWEMAIFAVALSNRRTREQALVRLTTACAPTELMLRIVRELQSYDLPGFRTVVEAATREITERPVTAWNREWFDRVRLVVSCLDDAQRLAAVRRPAYEITTAGWLERLVAGNHYLLGLIFGLYLTANPAEALRIAGELHEQERLLADRERILSAMEHPDMVAFVLTKISDGGPFSGVWNEMLAEAALRFDLVTQILLEEPVPDRLAALAEQVGPEFAWHRTGPVAGTFFGAALAVATSGAVPIGKLAPSRSVTQVDLVAMVKPRNRGSLMPYRPGWKTPLLMLAGTALALACGVYIVASAPGAETMVLLTAMLVTVVVGWGAMWLVWSGFVRRNGGFNAIGPLLNLEADAAVLSASPDILVTELGDGVRRLFVGDDVLQGARGDVDRVRFSQLSRDRVVLNFPDENRRHMIDAPRIADISRFSTFVQICTVSRRIGRRHCVPEDRTG